MYDEEQPAGSRRQVLEGELLPAQKSGTYAATRAAIDVQIATAKAYPRSLQAVGNNLRNWCTGDEQTAEACVYSLKRSGKTIRGPSIRFAEIVTHAWGHLRIDARIVDEGREHIIVRGECHDLQSNNVWAQDVTRRITTSEGRRYDTDLIGVTMMAAASIAQRDSVLKCVPAFIWRPAFDACLSRIAGDVRTLNDRRIKAVGQFSVLGVSAQQVFRKFGVSTINDISADHLIDLLGTFNAIREGETTVEAQFGEEQITSKSLGGSPLGAAEDDGTDAPVPAEQPAEPQKQAEARPSQGRAAKPSETPKREQASDRKASAQRSRAEQRPRSAGRQDRDVDAPPPAAEQLAAAAAKEEAAAKSSAPARAAAQAQPAAAKPVAEEKPAAAAPSAQEPAAAEAPGTQQGRYLDPKAGQSVDSLMRYWENDCLTCKTVDELRALAVSYGPRFEGRLNEEQEEMVREAYEAREEQIKEEVEADGRRRAAEAYEKAQNGDEPAVAEAASASVDEQSEPAKDEDDGGGEDDGEPEPQAEATSPMIERCADMEPVEPGPKKIWRDMVAYLDGADTANGVNERYAELEKNGTIAKLPEDAALNARTARFRIKKTKPA